MNNWIKEIFRKKSKVPVVDKNKLVITNYLPENPVILEAGCFDGIDTEEMARLWKNANIHAFEPVPGLYEASRKRLEPYPNIIVYPLALSDNNGEVDFYLSGGDSIASSSILKPLEHTKVHPEVTFKHTIKVQTVTIDSWARAHQIRQIDLMWLDMQGAEFNVLNASHEALQNCSLIFSEVSLIKTYEGVMMYPEFKAWLKGFGFEVVWEDLPYQDMGNVLFYKRK